MDSQTRAWDYVRKAIVENNKISHAYLIETNNSNDSLDFVKEMIKLMLLSNIKDKEEINKISIEVDNDTYPDIKYIDTDGYWIKKEQLLNIEKEFSMKSMLDNKLIYVIKEADKLNDSSANAILKFLEEPKDDIVAILVTSNRYNVIETIVSRCQIITLDGNNEINEENEDIISFIKDLSNPDNLVVNYNYYLNGLFADRDMAYNTISSVLEILDTKLTNNKSIAKQMIVLEEQKNKLNFNVNIKLWLNELIAKLVEVN